jgi:hypothetical protein
MSICDEYALALIDSERNRREQCIFSVGAD